MNAIIPIFSQLIVNADAFSADESLGFGIQPTVIVHYNSELNWMVSSSLIVGIASKDNDFTTLYGIGPSIDFSEQYKGLGVSAGVCFRNSTLGAGTIGSAQLSVTHDANDRSTLYSVKGAVAGGAMVFGGMVGYYKSERDEGLSFGIGVGF